MNTADHAQSSRPDISRWELSEILKSSAVSRDRLMSVDATSSSLPHPNHGTFLPSHFDHPIDSHPPLSASHLPMHPFDNDKMDVTEHSPYDIFAHPPQPTFPHQRIRSNTSPPAPSYGPSSEPIYSGMFSHDSVPSFHSPSAGHYDMMGSISSSLSSGKATPLTPNDPIGALPFSAGPPNGIKQDYGDLMSDRRLSAVSSNGFQSDIHDEFPLGVNPHSNFGSTTLPPFSDRFLVQSQLQGHPPDQLRSVPPQATHTRFDGNTPYDEISSYLIPSPQNDLSLRIPSVEDTVMRIRMGQMGAATDLHTFIKPYIDQYVRTPNRLAFGERTIIVMSSKVAQKSYGTEKRFLCPPPTAIMIGNSWWSDVMRRGEEPKLSPPRVIVSISGEAAGQEGNMEWSAAMGKPFDVSDPPTGTTYIGRCVGKQLFISDVDEKKKKVEALVKVIAPTGDDEPERVIGTFPSRPIKVISKPSKKRQSAKNLELCINHGSTISLFHRLRSQTVSTKYLCVSGSGSSFKGSDGAPLMGIDQRSRATTPSFIAKTSSWDPFVMYIVDAEKPAGGMDVPPPPPPHPDYPSPPPNAIPFMNNGTPIPIYYNQTVVLQCLTSGVVSPVLIIRKVDHQTTVVGGGAQEGSKGVGEQYCAPGEVCGDPVSQLHKVAFEVFEPGKGAPDPGSPGSTGAFLSCMGEKVNTYRPAEGRQWQNGVDGSRSPDSPIVPGSPIISTPASSGSGNDYFGSGPSSAIRSEPTSPVPNPMEFPSNDGGRVKKGKRGSSSAGGLSKSGASSKTRRRPTSAGSSGSRQTGSDSGASSGALWQVDIGETSVWTIVGTGWSIIITPVLGSLLTTSHLTVDQVRYNFYVPPVLFDNQNAPQTGSFPTPSKPVTPFPGVVKYLPPDRASEAPKGHGTRHMLAKPSPQTSKMLTLYGENFSKTDPVSAFFGSEPSPFVEVRCSEVLGCLPPENQPTKRRPIILVRGDGVVFPSPVMYP
ncbi:LAG1-DNAbind-domain-containing protein [Multifurca ochricompacta]|uniref:LAG1-DNAbind-domain-containing protein n=1 Tax=Multifurca ochricompacta TaxID=376703 RepID=A0AAD4MA71_9AGAM|nr:LAG1-DNAbind-domain-containing protein [Multifurca ochricompacta]